MKKSEKRLLALLVAIVLISGSMNAVIAGNESPDGSQKIQKEESTEDLFLSGVQTYSEGGVTVKARVTKDAKIPKDAGLTVRRIGNKDKEYRSSYQMAEQWVSKKYAKKKCRKWLH